MSRTVDRLDGLALPGHATVGNLAISLPALFETTTGGEERQGLFLRHQGDAIGTRHLILGSDGTEVHLRFPVLAPEVLGTGTGIHEIAERAYLLHAPCDPDALAALRPGRPELLVLGNARALWNEGLPFVEALRDLRGRVGPTPLLWTPRVALPHRLPMLAYLGVDVLDTTEGHLRAARGEYLDPTLGTSDRTIALEEHACDCPACSTDPPGPLSDHTQRAYRHAIAETRAAARSGRLRELAEARLASEPALAEMLRYADRLLAARLEERTPVTGAESHNYVLAESHRRPEMVRFRARLLERYHPPRSKTVLLLLPCSKTKPYRRSRSHRRFLGALDGLRALERVHVVSVSSPIGLVPRELENLYPARQYDIPVTGEWTEAERSTVLMGLDHLQRTGSYGSMIVHLDPVEYCFLRERLPDGSGVRWTLRDDRTTSPVGLSALRGAVSEALSNVASAPGGPLAVVREELQELASVQFGRSAAERLFHPPIRLAGRPWFQRLTDGSVDLATVHEERGLFHLTVAGARRIGRPYPLAVEIDPSLSLTGDLFVPGVRAADPEIRAGDSVVLLRSGELAGVGEAALSGPLMGELERGLAVRVRHRISLQTDTPMTAKESPTDDGPVV